MKTKFSCLAVGMACLNLWSANDGDFQAHEWGTFTSVHGGDGIPIEWNPITRTDLPGFVYSAKVGQGGPGGGTWLTDLPVKSSRPTFIRMETPVIYFYSELERTVDVTVDFPGGRITEWYPQASRVGPYTTPHADEARRAGQSFIEWRQARILAPGTAAMSEARLIREKEENHYYHARETTANFLQMSSPHARSGVENERHLFYRGIGYFRAPLTLQMMPNEKELRITTESKEPLTDLFVLTVRDGLGHYELLKRAQAGQNQTVPLETDPKTPLAEVQAGMARDMKRALIQQGLFAEEAQAMVDTWKSQWFAEPGVRVLYLMPASWTDETLPLAIHPKPRSTVRVMVGRAEMITPMMEWELNKQVVLYSLGDHASRQRAVSATRHLGLGRFLDPATRKLLGRQPSRAFAEAAWNLAREASWDAPAKNPLARN